MKKNPLLEETDRASGEVRQTVLKISFSSSILVLFDVTVDAVRDSQKPDSSHSLERTKKKYPPTILGGVCIIQPLPNKRHFIIFLCFQLSSSLKGDCSCLFFLFSFSHHRTAWSSGRDERKKGGKKESFSDLWWIFNYFFFLTTLSPNPHENFAICCTLFFFGPPNLFHLRTSNCQAARWERERESKFAWKKNHTFFYAVTK